MKQFQPSFPTDIYGAVLTSCAALQVVAIVLSEKLKKLQLQSVVWAKQSTDDRKEVGGMKEEFFIKSKTAIVENKCEINGWRLSLKMFLVHKLPFRIPHQKKIK